LSVSLFLSVQFGSVGHHTQPSQAMLGRVSRRGLQSAFGRSYATDATVARYKEHGKPDAVVKCVLSPFVLLFYPHFLLNHPTPPTMRKYTLVSHPARETLSKNITGRNGGPSPDL
jgi:hypothetical protein